MCLGSALGTGFESRQRHDALRAGGRHGVSPPAAHAGPRGGGVCPRRAARAQRLLQAISSHARLLRHLPLPALVEGGDEGAAGDGVALDALLRAREGGETVWRVDSTAAGQTSRADSQRDNWESRRGLPAKRAGDWRLNDPGVGIQTIRPNRRSNAGHTPVKPTRAHRGHEVEHVDGKRPLPPL